MKKLFKKIDSYRDYVIHLQTGMTACPAVTPHLEGGKGEDEKVKFLTAELKKLGVDEIKQYNCPDKKSPSGFRPNVAAKFYGADKTKTLWVLAHTDVVSPGDLKLWKTDPWKAVVKGDTIFGRGVEDNQQAIASVFAAARALKEEKIKPPVTLGIVLVADEEVGSVYGADFLIKKHKNIFGKNDFFLVPDVGSKDGAGAEIAEKGILWLKFTVTGAQGHGSLPSKFNNARRAGLHLALLLDVELHKKFNKKDKLFEGESGSTFEPTKVEANVSGPNIIPGTDVFYFDCRYLPSYKGADIFKVVAACVKKIEKQFKVKAKYEVEQHNTSCPTKVTAPVFKLFSAAVKEVNGKPAKPYGIGGGTVSAFLRNAGFDAVCCGKMNETMHTPNENSSIKNTLSDAKVFTHMLMNAGGKK